MQTSLSSIKLEVREGLATVTLAQPARGNPFDGDFTQDFKQVALALWETPALRAVLLRAEGTNFSVGGDLKKFHPERERLAPLVRKWTSDLHMGLSRFWQLPVPVVAEVQGFAMGGGVALLAGCDVVVAAESAKIGSAFAHLGFSCDSGSSVTLTARMGAARARRFVLMGEMLTSAQAQQAGLVDEVVPDAELSAAALKHRAAARCRSDAGVWRDQASVHARRSDAARVDAGGRGADAGARRCDSGCTGRHRRDGRASQAPFHGR